MTDTNIQAALREMEIRLLGEIRHSGPDVAAPDFNIQTALRDMETRLKSEIRDGISDVRQVALAARDVADETKDTTYDLRGRVISLEEKASWGIYGFAAGFAALCGMLVRYFVSLPRG